MCVKTPIKSSKMWPRPHTKVVNMTCVTPGLEKKIVNTLPMVNKRCLLYTVRLLFSKKLKHCSLLNTTTTTTNTTTTTTMSIYWTTIYCFLFITTYIYAYDLVHIPTFLGRFFATFYSSHHPFPIPPRGIPTHACTSPPKSQPSHTVPHITFSIAHSSPQFNPPQRGLHHPYTPVTHLHVLRHAHYFSATRNFCLTRPTPHARLGTKVPCPTQSHMHPCPSVCCVIRARPALQARVESSYERGGVSNMRAAHVFLLTRFT